jgi:hypothetical protein
VVLYLTVFRDGDGVPHVPRDVLRRIAAVSRAPVFGVFETYLGEGIVAGSIASYGAQGRSAGELVAWRATASDHDLLDVRREIRRSRDRRSRWLRCSRVVSSTPPSYDP